MVHAGDDAIYRPQRGKPRRVRVWGHTAKRVGVVFACDRAPGAIVLRYVKPESLERAGGGC